MSLITSELTGMELITFPVTFDAGEQGEYGMFMPYGYLLFAMCCQVTGDLSGTDDGTLTAKINGTPVTTGVITIPASTAAFSLNVVINPTAAHRGAEGSYLTVTSAKTTPGGKALVYFWIKRVP